MTTTSRYRPRTGSATVRRPPAQGPLRPRRAGSSHGGPLAYIVLAVVALVSLFPL